MKYAHYVMLEQFLREGAPVFDPVAPVPAAQVCENGRRVEEHERTLYELRKERVKIEQNVVDEGDIVVLRYFFRKARDTTAFFKGLGRLPEEDLQRLRDELDERLDTNCDFFFRLDEEALRRGELRLVDRGRCVQVKVSVAAYPKRRDTARATMREALSLAGESVERE